MLTAGWVRCNSSAAADRVPFSTVAIKANTWLKFIPHPLIKVYLQAALATPEPLGGLRINPRRQFKTKSEVVL
ncbi:hypothetical protein hamaS1_21770 [Moorella sp. Hama-1]|nr:hypothetical protein hamaS1_21770 [Moorella sp. Hama-1]